MKILIVIVTYNAMQWVERCLDSLRTSTIVPDVFIVDNGSTDGTQDYIKHHYPEVLFTQSKENIGFGRANNLGLQYAKDREYDYVYLLNQDAWLFSDTLEQLVGISKRNPEYGILSPFQMEANMNHIDRVFKADVCNWQSSPTLLDILYLHKDVEVIPVIFVMAAHWFITRDCLMKVGGFSPTFPHYGEDMNFINRAIFRKIKIGITPRLKVVHDRENRPTSKNKSIYLKYIFGLVKLSNPLQNVWYSLAQVSYTSIRSVFSLGSLLPVWNLFRIFFGLPRVLHNRRQSCNNECAFLN